VAELDSPGSPAGYPLGASVTVAELTYNPHPILRRLRAAEPVSWLPALGGWLVTRSDLAEEAMRNPRTFTVDDPRFSTARVVGPSMLSLDGTQHRRHRDPFAKALRAPDTRARLAEAAVAEAARLVTGFTGPHREAEIRRGLAGPLAVVVMAEMLGLDVDPARLLAWYDAIVAGVSALSVADDTSGSAGGSEPPVPAEAAAAFAELRAHVEAALGRGSSDSVLVAAADGLAPSEIVSDAAVLLFGGIETTEGMISNAIWYLLSDRDALRQVITDPELLDNAVDEALRLEPAAAVVDRYATEDTTLGSARIRRGDLVRVSLAGANRDPEVFADPDRFDIRRGNARQHLAFAIGPHFCIGAQLARLEANAAISALLGRLPGLRLDPRRLTSPEGLVFRKPASVHVCWDE
jgi:cytochrome P450